VLRRKSENTRLIRGVRAYIDDIERLHRELAQGCESVTIETKDYEVEAISDLRDYPKDRIPDLRLSGWQPSVSVNLSGIGASIHRHDSSDAAFALADRLRAILESSQRRTAWLYTWAGYIAIIAALNTANLAISLTDPFGDSSRWVARAVAVIAVILSGVLLYVFLWRGAVVYRVPRHEAPSFIRRNRDALIVNGLVGLVSVLATYFVTR
jgi:hypothetical protein